MRLFSHAGLLIPGTFPLFCQRPLRFLCLKSHWGRPRLLGLIAIMIGVVALLLISMWSLNGDVWKGDLLVYWREFSFGRFLPFAYALQVYHLWPPQGCLGLVSTCLLVGLLATGVVSSGMNLVSANELAWQFFVQSILVGLCTGF